ncbi:LamB/YcsF family protein [Calderihabitans maritimus]|uniref:5-oxoprolinase subunit A n=1 Tax=Calderihabitans maritimus TaxID=1246530 RepID=A0A1Z5HQW3_9FIRM|nr:5-oxoprolinase subunit PxpA [Calderihabitans maritimus]GAW91923.1 Uncharacterized proteins, homologs of lactam utilization protein B [Calderihabitans maritimus]
MTLKVDLNCDLGESFGSYVIGMDQEIIKLITSANIACGFHAGDPRVMLRTVNMARDYGVAVGAHPGILDLVGFGRRYLALTPEEAETDIIYQVGAMLGICRAAGVRLQHVKPHGALYNMVAKDYEVAVAVARGIAAVDKELIIFAQPGSAFARAGEELGLKVAYEVFADRVYNPDGTLVSRREAGAVIHDPEQASEQVLRMVLEGKVRTRNGEDIAVKADTICVHGDNPKALELVKTIRQRLLDAGVDIKPVGG